MAQVTTNDASSGEVVGHVATIPLATTVHVGFANNYLLRMHFMVGDVIWTKLKAYSLWLIVYSSYEHATILYLPQGCQEASGDATMRDRV